MNINAVAVGARPASYVRNIKSANTVPNYNYNYAGNNPIEFTGKKKNGFLPILALTAVTLFPILAVFSGCAPAGQPVVDVNPKETPMPANTLDKTFNDTVIRGSGITNYDKDIPPNFINYNDPVEYSDFQRTLISNTPEEVVYKTLITEYNRSRTQVINTYELFDRYYMDGAQLMDQPSNRTNPFKVVKTIINGQPVTEYIDAVDGYSYTREGMLEPGVMAVFDQHGKPTHLFENYTINHTPIASFLEKNLQKIKLKLAANNSATPGAEKIEKSLLKMANETLGEIGNFKHLV